MKVTLILFFLFLTNAILGQDSVRKYGIKSTQEFHQSVNVQSRRDSLKIHLSHSDSITKAAHLMVHRQLLDSLSKDSILRKVFFPHEQIYGEAEMPANGFQSRDMPGIKEVLVRKTTNHYWQFWVLAILLMLIATLRMMNVKRFNEIVLTAFDFNFDVKYWMERKTNYRFTFFILFLTFVASTALFFITFLERKKLPGIYQIDPQTLFLRMVLIGTMVFFAKIIIQWFFGYVLRMKRIAQLFLFNSLAINNFLGLVILVLNVLVIFSNQPLLGKFLTSLVFTVLVSGIILRLVKNMMLSPSQSAYPFIYLFAYLCAFEIFPWLIVFKFLLNTWFN